MGMEILAAVLTMNAPLPELLAEQNVEVGVGKGLCWNAVKTPFFSATLVSLAVDL